MGIKTNSIDVVETITVSGQPIADTSGNLKASNYICVGTSTLAATAGDIAAGLTGAAQFNYDQSANTIELRDGAGGTIKFSISGDTPSIQAHSADLELATISLGSISLSPIDDIKINAAIVGGANDGTGVIVGATGTAPSEGSTLQLRAFSTTEKNYLVPSAGSLLYDSTLDALQAYVGGAWESITGSSGGGEPFQADGTVIHFNDGTPGQKEVLYTVSTSVLPLANADNITLSISRTSRQIRGGGTTLPTTLVDTSQRLVTQRNLGDQVAGDGDMWLRAYGNTGPLFSDPPFIFEHHGTSSTTWPHSVRSMEINTRLNVTSTNVVRGDGGGISFGYDTGNGQAKWTIKAACDTTSAGSVSNLQSASLNMIGQGSGGAFIRSPYMSMFLTLTGVTDKGVVSFFPNVANFGAVRFPYHTTATGTDINHDYLPAGAGTINSGQLTFFVNNCTLYAKCAGDGSVVKIGPSPSVLPGTEAVIQTANDGGTVTQTGNQFTINLPASGNSTVTVTTPFIPGSVQDIVIQNTTAIGTGAGSPLTQIDFGDGTDVDRFGSKTDFTINHVTNRDNWTVTTEQFGTMYFTNTTAASTNIVLTPTGDWDGGTILITIYILKSTWVSYV